MCEFSILLIQIAKLNEEDAGKVRTELGKVKLSDIDDTLKVGHDRLYISLV